MTGSASATSVARDSPRVPVDGRMALDMTTRIPTSPTPSVLDTWTDAGPAVDPDAQPPDPAAHPARSTAPARAGRPVDTRGHRAGGRASDPVRAVGVCRAVDPPRALRASGPDSRPRGFGPSSRRRSCERPSTWSRHGSSGAMPWAFGRPAAPGSCATRTQRRAATARRPWRRARTSCGRRSPTARARSGSSATSRPGSSATSGCGSTSCGCRRRARGSVAGPIGSRWPMPGWARRMRPRTRDSPISSGRTCGPSGRRPGGTWRHGRACP